MYKGYLSNSRYIAPLLELKRTLRMRLQNFKCNRSNFLDLLKPHISMEIFQKSSAKSKKIKTKSSINNPLFMLSCKNNSKSSRTKGN